MGKVKVYSVISVSRRVCGYWFKKPHSCSTFTCQEIRLQATTHLNLSWKLYLKKNAFSPNKSRCPYWNPGRLDGGRRSLLCRSFLRALSFPQFNCIKVGRVISSRNTSELLFRKLCLFLKCGTYLIANDRR